MEVFWACQNSCQTLFFLGQVLRRHLGRSFFEDFGAVPLHMSRHSDIVEIHQWHTLIPSLIGKSLQKRCEAKKAPMDVRQFPGLDG